MKEKYLIAKKAIIRDKCVFTFYFFVLMFAYMPFMNTFFTHDYIPGYNIYLTKAVAMDYFTSGRFVNLFITCCYYMFDLVGVSHYKRQYVIQILGIILYSFSLSMLYAECRRYIHSLQNRFVVGLILLIGIVNPMIVERFTYGAFDWGVGMVLGTLAAIMFSREKWIWAVFFSFLAVSSYQSDIIIVALLAFFFQYIKNHFSEDVGIIVIIKKYCIICFCTCFSVVVNLLCQRIAVNSNGGHTAKRVSFVSNNTEKLQLIYERAKDIWQYLYGTMPKGSLLIYSLFLFLVGIFILVKNKRGIQSLIEWIMVYVAILVMPFSFGIATETVFYPPRTMCAILWGLAIETILVLLYVWENKALMYSVIGAFSLFFLINYYGTQTSILDCFSTRAIDHNEAVCIYEEIKEYEETSGNSVEQIVSYAEDACVYNYEEQIINPRIYSYTMRMVSKDWSRVDYLNFVNGTDYISREITADEIQKYGLDIGRRYNPSKQLFFEDNTMFWMVY